MMEVYKTPSKEIQDIVFANVTYKVVIEGLNGYFASEPRNDYITVKMESDKQNFALYEAEAWADILISWLRTKHGIFYYPGMEAKHAKIERIPPFTERMMDEGALNSLKALYKRVIGQAVGINSHTLIADSIKCAVNAKESAIEKMKERIAELESNFKAVCDEDDIFRTRALKAEEEVGKLKNSVFDMESMFKGVLIDTALEKKNIDSAAAEELRNLIFNDVVKVICQECYDRGLAMNSYNAEACIMRKEIEDLKLKLKNAEESDINALIRDYCTKNDIIAPSRYFSDKACVEYLFSVIDLKQKDRLFTILQDLYRDIFKKQPDGLSAEDIANKILDRVLETEDLLHRSVDSVNKECKATGRLMVDKYEKDLLRFIYKEYKGRTHLSDETVTYDPPSVRNTVLKIISDYARSRTRVDILETRIKSIFDRCKANFTVDDYVLNGDPTSSFMLDCISSWIDSPAESRGKTRAEIENYKLKLKDYILKDIKKHGYRYDGLETKSIEEIVDRIITMATLDRSNIALRDIYTTVASPVERRRYNIDNCDGEIVDHMKDYILRRFEGLRINTEYCLRKMAELDGRQKDLKILEEQQEWLVKQNSELATKVSAKDDEISRLKDLINAMNEEVKDM